MFEKIKSIKLKNIYLKFFGNLRIQKTQIITAGTVFLILILASFLVEYYGFAGKLNISEKQNKGVFVVKNSDIVAENFTLNERGAFYSQSENASLTLLTQHRYINNLEVELDENPNFPITVSYLDPENKQEIILEKKVQKKMQKMKLDFLDRLVFNIQNNPEKIIIRAVNTQTAVSKIKIDNSYYFNSYRFLFVLAIGILMLVFVLYRKKIGKNPEYGFFAIALICGTLISVSEPLTYVSWDEHVHHNRADNNSFKSIIKKDVKDIYSSAESVPASYSIKEQESINKFFDNDYKKETKKKKKSKEFSLLDTYNSLGYIPSSVALMFGRIINLPNHIIFILGRWINALVFALIVFFAIRKLKTGKMIMAIIALFPTSIFLASNYGYDSWVTAFTMLGLAYIFSELQQPDKKMTMRETCIMIGSLVIGLGPKAIYFPLMMLLFLLKPAKFDSPNQYKKFILAGALSFLFVVGSFMLPFIISGPGDGDSRGGEAVNSAEQVKFILSEPLAYAKILFNFTKEYINPKNASGFMTFFAYLGSLGGYLFVLVSITLVVVTLTDKNKFDEKIANWKVRLSVIGVYLVTVALISTALYVAFTAVRSVEIAGVQLRYLIPLVFPMLFILGSSRIRIPMSRNIYNTAIFAIMTFVLLQGIWELIIKLHF